MADQKQIHLEEALAHHEAIIEDLSDQIRNQAAQIDRLERRVAQLTQRAAQSEADSTQGSIPLADQKPPHY